MPACTSEYDDINPKDAHSDDDDNDEDSEWLFDVVGIERN